MVWVLALHHLRRVMRRPLLILFLLLLPCTLTWIEFAAFGSADLSAGSIAAVPVVLLDADGTANSSALSACLVNGFGGSDLAVQTTADRNAALVQFKRGEVSALISIPAGFGYSVETSHPAQVTYSSNPAFDSGAGIAVAALKICTDTLSLYWSRGTDNGQLAAVVGPVGKPLASVRIERSAPVTVTSPSRNDFFAEHFPGLIFFGVLCIGQAMAAMLLRDRASGLQRRLRMLRVSEAQWVAGALLYLTLGLFILTLLLAVAGSVLFGLDLLHVYGIVLVALGFAACAAGLQLTISGLVATPRAAQSVSSVCMLMLSMAGGAFIPTSDYPAALKHVAQWLPNAVGQQAMTPLLGSAFSQDVLLSEAVAGRIGIVWLWAVALCCIAFATHRQRLLRNS